MDGFFLKEKSYDFKSQLLLNSKLSKFFFLISRLEVVEN